MQCHPQMFANMVAAHTDRECGRRRLSHASFVGRQHFSCKVDRADSRWGYEVALEPVEDIKLGAKFSRDFACGVAREFSLAAFEGVMLMCVRPSGPGCS
jgi:hypothetical protein